MYLIIAWFLLFGISGFAQDHKKDFHLSDSEFASLIQDFSESDSNVYTGENFISNENSYLQIFPKALKLGVGHDVYIGVAPDQNFTYIYKFKPKVAFIVDIRRQNLLEILMFKAIFEMADTPLKYLQLLFARKNTNIDALLDAPASTYDKKMADETLNQIIEKITAVYKIPLSRQDEGMLKKIYWTFYVYGGSITCNANMVRPTFTELVREKDLNGKRGHYLFNKKAYQYLRRMYARNLIVPLTGNFTGDKTFFLLSNWLKERQLTVSVFYISNVEYYIQDSSNPKRPYWFKNVQLLPWHPQGIIIRSYFSVQKGNHPEFLNSYLSLTLVEKAREYIELFESSLQDYDSVIKYYIKLRK